uniref:C3H1-type domain-containing protein n=1 Tax=Esox lucius TaxID=8010 RepID=A0AAY5KTS1_ESOLU
MSKIRRKVTVENSKTISDSNNSSQTATPSRRPSVFERLGPSTGSNAVETHCRNWLKTGNCSYGNTCRYTHGTQPRGKGFSGSFSRSAERPTGDLRERMKNKRQDVDSDAAKRDPEETTSPTTRQRDPSRGRHREKEDIKITKERTPASEEEPADWEANREDSDNGDYDYELSLEMKRQKIQRELMKLEQENMDKREDIVIKKEVPVCTSPERSSSKGSPSSRKSAGSPKHTKGAKASGSGKKEKKTSVSSPASDTVLAPARSSKGGHGKKKGPRTPSPPPPLPPLENTVVVSGGKKHKAKHKNKEKSVEKPSKEGKERGRDTEKHKEKKEKRR